MVIKTGQFSITEISKNGNGLGLVNVNDLTVLCEVPFTVPGDVVKVEIDQIIEGKAKVALHDLIVPSPLRVSPRCTHFTKCGGCRLQHIPYQGQLLHKEKMIKDSFAGLLTGDVILHPILPSKVLWNYRNKMDYTFSYNEDGKCHLGHVQEGTKGKVVDIHDCVISPQWFMDALICVKQWWESSRMLPYDPTSNKGVLRLLTLRDGRRSGDRMVVLTVSNSVDFELSLRHIEKFVAQLTEYVKPHQAGNELSIYLRIHQTEKGVPSSKYDMLLYGPGYIREALKIKLGDEQEPADLAFEVGPFSFFQANPHLSEALYSRAIQMLTLTEQSIVYDLYCGTGVIGICMSRFAKQVYSAELSSEAAENARRNCELNKCSNIKVYAGAVRYVLEELKEDKVPKPDIVVVNPPRSGLEPCAMELLLNCQAHTILYISCMPATQALNIQALIKQGYRLKELQPVDQMPQTNHIFSIALLTRSS